jgi:hypothetical protein
MRRLAGYAHDLTPLDLWLLARVYIAREADNASTEDLATYLGVWVTGERWPEPVATG